MVVREDKLGSSRNCCQGSTDGQRELREVFQGGCEILFHLHQLWTCPDFAQPLWAQVVQTSPFQKLNSPVICHFIESFSPHFLAESLGGN